MSIFPYFIYIPDETQYTAAMPAGDNERHIVKYLQDSNKEFSTVSTFEPMQFKVKPGDGQLYTFKVKSFI